MPKFVAPPQKYFCPKPIGSEVYRQTNELLLYLFVGLVLEDASFSNMLILFIEN
jgi:hypothetical protein